MTQRLSPVISTRDFPEAEIAAMLLDGEVYRVDRCVSPIDVPPGPEQRLAALERELPARLILERRSAAWVWGALFLPPARHEACTSLTGRWRPPYSTRVTVREIAIGPAEITRFAAAPALALTTPLRTAMDIARYSETFGDVEVEALLTLLGHAGTTVEECRTTVAALHKLPYKKRALRRLGVVARTDRARAAGVIPS